MPINYQMTWDPATSLYLPTGVAGSWILDFNEDFDGSEIDDSRWQVMDPDVPWQVPDSDFESTLDGFPNTWRQKNIAVADSVLTLSLTLEGGVEYAGALLSLWPQTLGFYEARLKFVSGWPAWWSAPKGLGDGPDPEDPAIWGTEIDIAEGRPWAAAPANIQHAVHWNGYAPERHQSDEHHTATNDGDWHVVGLHWTADFYRFYLDGVQTWEFTEAISQNANHNMILNCGYYIGGQTDGVAHWDYVRHWSED